MAKKKRVLDKYYQAKCIQTTFLQDTKFRSISFKSQVMNDNMITIVTTSR